MRAALVRQHIEIASFARREPEVKYLLVGRYIVLTPKREIKVRAISMSRSLGDWRRSLPVELISSIWRCTTSTTTGFSLWRTHVLP